MSAIKIKELKTSVTSCNEGVTGMVYIKSEYGHNFQYAFNEEQLKALIRDLKERRREMKKIKRMKKKRLSLYDLAFIFFSTHTPKNRVIVIAYFTQDLMKRLYF